MTCTCISEYWGLSARWWGSGRGISSTASLCRPGHGTDGAVYRYIDMAAHLYVGGVESERGRHHLRDVPLQQRREALRPGHLPEPGQVVAWRKDLLPTRHASDVWRYLYLYLQKVPIVLSPLCTNCFHRKFGLFIRETFNKWTFGSQRYLNHVCKDLCGQAISGGDNLFPDTHLQIISRWE